MLKTFQPITSSPLCAEERRQSNHPISHLPEQQRPYHSQQQCAILLICRRMDTLNLSPPLLSLCKQGILMIKQLLSYLQTRINRPLFLLHHHHHPHSLMCNPLSTKSISYWRKQGKAKCMSCVYWAACCLAAISSARARCWSKISFFPSIKAFWRSRTPFIK